MKLSLQLAFISAANITFIFVSQWYVLTQLGPGVETDALFASMAIPQLVLAVLSGSLMHVLVPLFSGESDAFLRRETWGLLGFLGGIFTIIALIFYATALWWVPLLVPGFSESGQALTVILTRIQLVGMIFAAIHSVQWAVYHARQQFLWAEFAPLLVSAFALLVLILSLPRFGIVAAAWASTLRMALQAFFLSFGMGRPICPDLRSLSIRKTWQRIKPLLLGAAYYKTDPVVDRFLLSTASSGSLSLYYLAQQMYTAGSQVLNKAIVAPLVPVLSMLHKAGDMQGFKRLYCRKLLHVGALSLAGMLVLFVGGQKLLSLLIGFGSVNICNVKELWWVLVWLCGMFVGSFGGQVVSSAFYAIGDTVTPTRMSMFTYTVYIPSKVISFYLWGITGLAISTSIYYLTNLSLLVYLFSKKYNIFLIRKV